MRYKLTGELQVWNLTNFKGEVNGKIVNYNNTGNIINWIVLEVDNPIKNSLLKDYGLKVEIFDGSIDNFIRNKIIDILHREHILIPQKEFYYLKDRYGNSINFSTTKEINIIDNDYFRIFIQNKRIYAEAIGDHTINDKWIGKLNKSIKLRDRLKSELEDIL